MKTQNICVSSCASGNFVVYPAQMLEHLELCLDIVMKLDVESTILNNPKDLPPCRQQVPSDSFHSFPKNGLCSDGSCTSEIM